MSEKKPSRTALATAYIRVAHQLLDAQPWILEDPIAERLLGKNAAQRIFSSVERHQTPGAKALRSHIVLRSRFAEDRLLDAARRGVAQYVILGAGFDTFSLRQPGWAQSLKIFEVDQPGSQSEKRSRISEAGIEIPENVSFVEIDFEHELLLDGLLRHRISLTLPTFFSWLGVTMYLNGPAIDATLRSVMAFPAGTEIVFTFLQSSESTPYAGNRSSTQLAQHVADAGEPFVSCFEPQVLEDKLIRMGFTEVKFLSPEEADDLYFKSRPVDLPIPHRTGIVSAIR